MVGKTTALGVLTGLLTVGLGVWGKYEEWYWYDNAAHLVAGLSLGALATDDESSRLQDLLFVATVTVFWEIHEYRHGVYPWDGSVPSHVAAEDTLLDTLLVLLGALVASEA